MVGAAVVATAICLGAATACSSATPKPASLVLAPQGTAPVTLNAPTTTGGAAQTAPNPSDAGSGTPTSVPPAAGPTPAAPSSATEALTVGSDGVEVAALQRRLTALGYRPGPDDGTFGADTASAVLAFQKRQGLPRDGDAGPTVLAALNGPQGAGPRPGLAVPRVEVDIARQIAFVVLPSQPVITINVSTGTGQTYSVPGGGTAVAYTPVGSFTALRKIQGDEQAPLGTLHSPTYFYKGWALHGSGSVPAYPASHGCVRMSNADADWIFPLIPVGTTVEVYDTSGNSPRPEVVPAGAVGA